MTKLITKPQPRGRVAGKFIVGVNGTYYRLTVGETFTENDALLEALRAAGVSYEDAPYNAIDGTPSGRIKVISVDTRIILQLNGVLISRIYGNVFFTPTAQELEAIQHSSLTYITEYVAPGGGDAGIGDQIFPMPAWAAESGIVSNVGWTIGGGVATCTEDAVLTVTPTKTLVEGIYRVSVTFEIPSGAYSAQMNVAIAGSNSSSVGDGLAGTKTADIIVDALDNQTIVLTETNGLFLRLTAFTVTRTE